MARMDSEAPASVNSEPHPRSRVTARPERLLRLERRANRPQAHRRGERPPAHRGEDRLARDGEALRKEPHSRLRVRERAVPIPGVDPVRAEKAVQRLARESLPSPLHLRPRARPGPRPRARAPRGRRRPSGP